MSDDVRSVPAGRRGRRWLAPVIAALAAVALLAACGGNDEETTSSATTATATAAASGSTSTAALPVGPAVTSLQTVMTSLGYYTGAIDGVYGPETADGVKKMQTALGVPADGIYGPETHNALGDAAKPIVMALQEQLATYGYYSGAIDGQYGDATKAAVEQLQTDLGVTVDGRVGPETVTAFNEAVASGKIKPV